MARGRTNVKAKEESAQPGISDLRSRVIALHKRREHGKAEVGRRIRGPLSRADRTAILNKTQSRCHICGGAIEGNDWNADHVFSHSGGGSSNVDNYLAAHGPCNSLRWDYLPEERQLIATLGMLARAEVEKGTDLGKGLAALAARRTAANTRRRGPPKGGRDV